MVLKRIPIAVLLIPLLAACSSGTTSSGPIGSNSGDFACNDLIDNDLDGLIDSNDPGCLSPEDNDESDPTLGGTPSACDDGIDNDSDGLIDFGEDPGCSSARDNDESDAGGGTPAACDDGLDNDSDGVTDFPDDPGCDSASDDDESNAPDVVAACADGVDNDNDGVVDLDDPGCESALDNDETDPVVSTAKTRYAMNNQCWAIKANGNDAYIALVDGSYQASAADKADAEPFFLKPSALGKYLLYSSQRDLLTASGASTSTTTSAAATDSAEWTVVGVGDTTDYPPTPAYHEEPTPEQVALWHGFDDPALTFDEFTLFSAVGNANLAVGADGALVTQAPADDAAQSFTFEATTGCAQYPEASSDVSGIPFAGSTADGRVLGHADVHVHISSTEFLGGAQHGMPYHKFGVEHALDDCDAPDDHGPGGSLDLLSAAFSSDFDGHAVDGYPTFSEWPARNSLTHEAIYWRWLERSWAGGLRVVVNDLVDNTTLCELERNAKGNPTEDCNSMNNAGRQAGTMYGMENYIDAQYGGPGMGFFQIVHSPEEAREVIEDGKMAVVLGIEISNLFDCQVTYNPLRTQEPFEETGSVLEGGNTYNCTMEEGQPHSILTQIQRVYDWGVRQIISIHEFDNAFGGNGIFDGMVLNLGNRENSGGIPSSDLAYITDGDLLALANNLSTVETPTGEFWTTYDCPIEDETPGFSGWFWGNSGGATQSFLPAASDSNPFGCLPTGQGGRYGGSTPCYPSASQCNARWMTPIGQYMFGKLMEMGFIIDFDHLAVGIKTQLLELAEAQDPVYPLVSTHGTFGGITNDQAQRVLRGGGFLYPSNGSSRGFVNNMNETLSIYQQAVAGLPEAERPLFGFGYGTDTNGLSAQSGPRGNIEAGKEVVYPFTFFSDSIFGELPDFDTVEPVLFNQPTSRDATGEVIRTWHEDVDGNAHHGMIADFIQEMRLEADAEHMRHLFNSAEAYLQTWERTSASSQSVQSVGLQVPGGLLRAAPVGAPDVTPYP